jgi:aryl-alcohol dehydrogenase-like predicted oxidoreductase
METRQFGKTDMRVSVLGFGGAEIGYAGLPLSTAEKLLHEALDAGVNVIDTAECYADSEELIGSAIGKRRKEYYLFTKCGHGPGWTSGWQPKSIQLSLERSLNRLKTDYLDLLQLHSCSEEELRRGSAIEALSAARSRGQTRFIGYSGDSRAALYAVESGAFDALQISVNIADQESLDLVLPRAIQRQMGVIAKRPLANVAWQNGKRLPNDAYARPYWDRLQKLDYDFLLKDLKESVPVALRFTLSVHGVHTAIVGTIKPGRIAENAAALEGGPLPVELFSAIRARWRGVAPAGWVGQT